MAIRAHSKFGASKMGRILACPGSASLEGKFPDQTNDAARVGSGAHRVGESCLLSGRNAADHIGTQKLLEDGFSVPVDEEMAKAVQVYLNEVRQWQQKLGGSILEVEKEGTLEWIDKDVWGTNDVSIRQFMGTLVVIDYKHGAGVPVDVLKDGGEVNPQLMQYALQALGAPPKTGVENYEEVIVGIVQPRSFHPDGPIRYAPPMDPADVRAWGEKILKPGVKAAKKRNAPLHAGSHCRFCRAAQGCPEIHKQATDAAVEVFQGDIEAGKPLDPIVMTPDQISRVLGYEKILKEWLKSVESRAFHMLAAGETIPGFKLVQKKTHRKWVNPGDVRALLAAAQVDDDLILTERVLRTPAQIEKVAKDLGLSMDVNSMTTKPVAASIAPLSDKRSAFVPGNAGDLFDEIEEE